MSEPDPRQARLRQLPSLTALLAAEPVTGWLKEHPRPLVTECLRRAADQVRQRVLNTPPDRPGPEPLDAEAVLAVARQELAAATQPRLRGAINATGVLLHTGLGRSVFADTIVDSVAAELKGYVTLAIDRTRGERIERDELIEPILTELTGAEAATVVCNNAAGTLLVLAALAAGREVIVSRGQLIEIGGSFRLPEVMQQSHARLVEVGTTNRTHLKDYRNAITENTAALMRVHPSNYRVIGFTHEVEASELAKLAHERGLVFIDDLGAGALLDLETFGLPHEPTARESIEAGADVALFSADKLIGGSQGGILIGRKSCIDRIRQHPLMRAVRVDKTCLMILERTLHLFRDRDRLAQEHPIYRMLSTPLDTVRARARCLAQALQAAVPSARIQQRDSHAYLGSGSLPAHALPSVIVAVAVPGVGASTLARRFRLDAACVFARVENDEVCLDARTVRDHEILAIAAAFGRVAL